MSCKNNAFSICKPHFINTLVVHVMSYESKACSVFSLQACLHAARVCMGPCLHNSWMHIEKVLHNGVTIKVLVKWSLYVLGSVLIQYKQSRLEDNANTENYREMWDFLTLGWVPGNHHYKSLDWHLTINRSRFTFQLTYNKDLNYLTIYLIECQVINIIK